MHGTEGFKNITLQTFCNDLIYRAQIMSNLILLSNPTCFFVATIKQFFHHLGNSLKVSSDININIKISII